MFNKLKNIKQFANKKKRVCKNNNRISEAEPVTIPEDKIEELCSFFKKCSLPSDVTAVKEKLKDTAGFRKTYLQKHRCIYDSSRHLYIVNPILVGLLYLILTQNIIWNIM